MQIAYKNLVKSNLDFLSKKNVKGTILHKRGKNIKKKKRAPQLLPGIRKAVEVMTYDY